MTIVKFNPDGSRTIVSTERQVFQSGAGFQSIAGVESIDRRIAFVKERLAAIPQPTGNFKVDASHAQQRTRLEAELKQLNESRAFQVSQAAAMQADSAARAASDRQRAVAEYEQQEALRKRAGEIAFEREAERLADTGIRIGKR